MQNFQAYPAPAKLNLFLHIVGQRADGYHLLQSVFQLIDLSDTIHIRLRDDEQINHLNPIPGVPAEEDLTVRAAKAMQTIAQSKQPSFNFGIDLKVDKHIPMGGGLGGGSTDAATVLLALNKLWKVNLSREALMQTGLTLGADVPFFIFGQNAWVEGIGEQCQAIDLAPNHYVVLNPNAHISTKEIFNNKHLTKDANPTKMSDFSNGADLKDSLTLLKNVKTNFINHLEKIVCQLSPDVNDALNWLKQFGDARMTGSGASIFLEVDSKQTAQDILDQKPAHLTGFMTKGLLKHPLKAFC